MVSHSHASRRDLIVRRARELVRQDRVQFALAGQRLDQVFSEETVKVDDSEPLGPGEKYAVEETPEQLLFMRLNAALNYLRSPDQHRYDNHLDFQANASIEDRRMLARMAVLVFLAAIDPNKGEAIDESMGEIASIPFELWERKNGVEQSCFGGSEWVRWDDPNWDHPNEPSPDVLKVFQHAIDVAKHGSSEGARDQRIPSSRSRDCIQKGLDSFDECERAIRDLQRHINYFELTVQDWRFGLNQPTDMKTHEERDRIRRDLRRMWMAFTTQVKQRARDAIMAIDLAELASQKQAALTAIAELWELYPDPIPLNGEEPGDHLLRMAIQNPADPRLAQRLERIGRALDDLDLLRRGCLPFVGDAPDSDTRQAEVKPTKKRRPPRTKEEIQFDELRIANYLSEHPDARRDDVASVLSLPKATVSKSQAWKMNKAQRLELAKKQRPIVSTNLIEGSVIASE